jgi:hypothetical protein
MFKQIHNANFFNLKNSKRLLWQAVSGGISISKKVSGQAPKKGVEPNLPHRGTRIPMDDKQTHTSILKR